MTYINCNKSAREMFEELGYELLIFDENLVVTYKKKQCISDIDYIQFNVGEQLIECFTTSDSPFIPAKQLSVSVKELKAINKQVEELGWNNE